ncbi:proteasome subunit beta [Streptomyces sp. M10(2022)]
MVLAGDRRATMGNMIAQRDIEKVFPADEYSAVGIAGTAGLAVEMVKLFQLELEHFEKVEGATLSLEGKANRLSTMIRSNLAMAMQGLAVVPLFAGTTSTGRGPDLLVRRHGRPFRGAWVRRHRLGSIFARGSMKKLYHDDLTEEQTLTLVVQALYDAADDDSATGGPDVARRIYPIVTVITDEGFRRLTDVESSEIARSILERRMEQPDGPRAALL